MKKNKLRIIVPTILVVVLALLALTLLIPGAVTAQGRMSLKSQRALSTFSEVFQYIERNYVDEVDPQVLLEGALAGLFESLDDPHSAYLSDVSIRDLSDTTEGKFGGVGLYIQKQIAEGEEAAFIEVIAPIEGTPSSRLGIRSKDLIIEIDGESTADFTIDDAVGVLRGRVGTPAQVLIRRKTREFPISITRASIEIPTIRHGLVPSSSIGYIRIIQFTPFTADRVADAIKEFANANYQSLIVDVRQNPGGLLSSVIDVSNLFLDGGLIVGTSGRNAIENNAHNAKAGALVEKDISIIVLIDSGSASASEIFAGALGDRDRAVIMGQTSFGKGSVQQIREAGEGAFRLTTSRYYTPDGNYIDNIGIVPDIASEAEEFTEEQEADLTIILSKGRVEKFVNDRAKVSEQEVSRFIAEIVSATSLRNHTIEKLVRDEILRVNNITPVFDIEFDAVLRQAIEYLVSN